MSERPVSTPDLGLVNVSNLNFFRCPRLFQLGESKWIKLNGTSRSSI
ncbi:MAG: hypothetical protein AAF665_04780 [Pseudomonadota bacterium]